MARTGSLLDLNGMLDLDPLAADVAAVPEGVPALPEVAAEADPSPTSEPDFSSQWYLRNTGQNGGTAGADINVVPAWSMATGAGVSIVVNDTGVDYNNPDITANYDAATSYSLDAPNNDAYPYNTGNLPSNEQGDLAHGTWVTGLIAAADNGYGIVGVAY